MVAQALMFNVSLLYYYMLNTTRDPVCYKPQIDDASLKFVSIRGSLVK